MHTNGNLQVLFLLPALILLGWGANPLEAGAASGNIPSSVSIISPSAGFYDTIWTALRIKAEAADQDGTVAEVRFYADTNLVGVVTNPPFTIIWWIERQPVYPNQSWDLTAVAIDNLGAATQSSPVKVYYCTDQHQPALEQHFYLPRSFACHHFPSFLPGGRAAVAVTHAGANVL